MTPTVMAHLDNLMQETFPRRRKLILAPDNMDTSELVEKLWKDFPCLQNDTCVSIYIIENVASPPFSIPLNAFVNSSLLPP